MLAAPLTAADPTPFAAFVDDYYAAVFDWDPTQATAAGVHDRDDRLPDRSAAAVADRLHGLHKLADRLAALPADKFTAADAVDADVERGKQLFVDEGFIEPEVGFQEARRGTYNPTYLDYTLGKLQIYKLRAVCQKARGKEFTLKAFHDEFVRQGGLPIKQIRRLMLPGDTGPTF